jgi:hypothetical protein
MKHRGRGKRARAVKHCAQPDNAMIGGAPTLLG